MNEYVESLPPIRWHEPKDRYDVVIIGGGGHGLSTAYYLATRHGIAHGDLVHLSTARATARFRARVTDTIGPGTLFVPFHWGGDSSANALTAAVLDPTSRMPSFSQNFQLNVRQLSFSAVGVAHVHAERTSSKFQRSRCVKVAAMPRFVARSCTTQVEA